MFPYPMDFKNIIDLFLLLNPLPEKTKEFRIRDSQYYNIFFLAQQQQKQQKHQELQQMQHQNLRHNSSSLISVNEKNLIAEILVMISPSHNKNKYFISNEEIDILKCVFK